MAHIEVDYHHRLQSLFWEAFKVELDVPDMLLIPPAFSESQKGFTLRWKTVHSLRCCHITSTVEQKNLSPVVGKHCFFESSTLF